MKVTKIKLHLCDINVIRSMGISTIENKVAEIKAEGMR